MISLKQNCFAIDQSPIWMDCSTTKQCLKLEDCIGGAKNMAEITGSRAYEVTSFYIFSDFFFILYLPCNVLALYW